LQEFVKQNVFTHWKCDKHLQPFNQESHENSCHFMAILTRREWFATRLMGIDRLNGLLAHIPCTGVMMVPGTQWRHGGIVFYSRSAETVNMLLNKGKAGAVQFISEKTIQSFLTKDKFNNGLGWMMDSTNSFMKNLPPQSFGHTGFTGTSIVVIPQSGISIILLINRQNIGLLNNKEYYNVGPIRQQVLEAVMAELNP
jgi:CubicO group peptidase (beta-lactamase class C family)